MRLRIEQILPALPAAGMEMVAARLTRALTVRGHDVGITCIEFCGDLGEQLRAEGYRVTVVPTRGKKSIFFPAALAAWLRERAPQVVHSHSGAWLKSARGAAMAGVPRVVHTVHGIFEREPWHGPPRKWLAAHYTSAIAAVSQPLYDYLRTRARIPEHQLHVLPNGVDGNVFRPGPRSGVLRRRFDLDDERFVIGHVARLHTVKNQAVLLDAFARLHERRPESFLALVGDGALRADLEARATALGVRDDVGFFGLADDLPPIYRDFDSFVLSSRKEGTSMSILEAMASGLAVVATAVGGTPDLLDHGRAGRLVPTEAAAALADALADLAGSPTERARLGQLARERVMSHYDEAAVVDAYLDLFLGKPRTTMPGPHTEPVAHVQ